MRIRSSRIKKKMTQNQLASKAGISQGNLSQYETGRSVPSVPVLYRIARALGTTMDDLYKPESAA